VDVPTATGGQLRDAHRRSVARTRPGGLPALRASGARLGSEPRWTRRAQSVRRINLRPLAGRQPISTEIGCGAGGLSRDVVARRKALRAIALGAARGHNCPR